MLVRSSTLTVSIVLMMMIVNSSFLLVAVVVDATTQLFISQTLGATTVTIQPTDTLIEIRDSTFSDDLEIEAASSASLHPSLQIIIDNVQIATDYLYIGKNTDFNMIGGSLTMKGCSVDRLRLGYTGSGNTASASFSNVKIEIVDNTFIDRFYLGYVYSSSGDATHTIAFVDTTILIANNIVQDDFYVAYAAGDTAPNRPTCNTAITRGSIDIIGNQVTDSFYFAYAKDGTATLALTDTLVNIEGNTIGSSETLFFLRAKDEIGQQAIVSATISDGTNIFIKNNRGVASDLDDIHFAEADDIARLDLQFSGGTINKPNVVRISGNTVQDTIRFGFASSAPSICNVQLGAHTHVAVDQNTVLDDIYFAYGWDNGILGFHMGEGSSLSVDNNTVSSEIRICQTNTDGRGECSFSSVALSASHNTADVISVGEGYGASMSFIFSSGSMAMTNNLIGDELRIGKAGRATSDGYFSGSITRSRVLIAHNNLGNSDIRLCEANRAVSHLAFVDSVLQVDQNTFDSTGEVRVAYGYLAATSNFTVLSSKIVIERSSSLEDMKFIYSQDGATVQATIENSMISILGNDIRERLYFVYAIRLSSTITLAVKGTNFTVNGNNVGEDIHILRSYDGTPSTASTWTSSTLTLSSNVVTNDVYFAASEQTGTVSWNLFQTPVAMIGNRIQSLYYGYSRTATSASTIAHNDRSHLLLRDNIGTGPTENSGSLNLGYSFDPGAMTAISFLEDSDVTVLGNDLQDSFRFCYAYIDGSTSVTTNGNSDVYIQDNMVGRSISYGYSTGGPATAVLTQTNSAIRISGNTAGDRIRVTYLSSTGSSLTSLLTDCSLTITSNRVADDLRVIYASNTGSTLTATWTRVPVIIRSNTINAGLYILREVTSEIQASISFCSFSIEENHIGESLSFLKPANSFTFDYSALIRSNNITKGTVDINLWKMAQFTFDENSLRLPADVSIVGEAVRTSSALSLSRFLGCNYFRDRTALTLTNVANFTRKTNCVFSPSRSRTVSLVPPPPTPVPPATTPIPASPSTPMGPASSSSGGIATPSSGAASGAPLLSTATSTTSHHSAASPSNAIGTSESNNLAGGGGGGGGSQQPTMGGSAPTSGASGGSSTVDAVGGDPNGVVIGGLGSAGSSQGGLCPGMICTLLILLGIGAVIHLVLIVVYFKCVKKKQQKNSSSKTYEEAAQDEMTQRKPEDEISDEISV